jgi:hypothetical protein
MIQSEAGGITLSGKSIKLGSENASDKLITKSGFESWVSEFKGMISGAVGNPSGGPLGLAAFIPAVTPTHATKKTKAE